MVDHAYGSRPFLRGDRRAGYRLFLNNYIRDVGHRVRPHSEEAGPCSYTEAMGYRLKLW